jgi:ABC-type antimicrobial peptide transport system permease subunit
MGYRQDVAYIPIGTLDKNEPWYPGGQVAFLAPLEMDLDTFVQQVTVYFKSYHPEGEPKFILAADVVNDSLAWRMRLYAMMSTFAGFSLVVGGLGIMNISFLWVVSHWREMGIRRACGASSANILMQVFIFAIKLAGLATLVGSIAGTLVAGVIQLVSGWQLTIYPYWLLVSIGTGFGLAFLFSMMPAIWAARQHPMTLLSMDL